LGLPGYSSHQYSLSVWTEVSDLSQIETGSASLYEELQVADREEQKFDCSPNREGKQTACSLRNAGIAVKSKESGLINWRPDVDLITTGSRENTAIPFHQIYLSKATERTEAYEMKIEEPRFSLKTSPFSKFLCH
jgi:hypothetical protein